ncbi:hypothetical protein [Synoicihabitans lomoniglobus]|uniref:Lipoprotein n=1 Tax=Synoicihabitans lomoniglobus TaxID=2909285 RepID=A0AAF0CP06_9BACT|nr:hypothetical protein [Opitutaceae bacterium LMO-M01]WED65376.1 hypothetical protein PXH66_00750 [Opitutaceae bacterium LMO-M01]
MPRFSTFVVLLSLLVLAGCNRVEPQAKPTLSATFTTGWLDLEKDGTSEWRWSEPTASIALTNDAAQAETVVVEFDVLSISARSLQMTLGNKSLPTLALPLNEWVHQKISVELSAGISPLTFTTTEAGATVAGDTRSLYFCVRNFAVAPPEPAVAP